MALNITKTSQVSPVTVSTEPLVLPLTFFDLLWLKLYPTEQLMFYKLSDSESSPSSFYSSVLPKIEQSLSLALSHFLPLSGRLTWDPQDPKPHILISPDDVVSLRVVETEADFARLTSKGQLCHETEFRPLIPDLHISGLSAPLLSLQITLFPMQGFCIGTKAHHVAMDGKIAAKFHKSWAHVCKHGTIPKDFQLPTLLDRSVVNVPATLEHNIFELSSIENNSTKKSLKVPPARDFNDVVRISLELTEEDVEKLKERAKNESTRTDIRFSTFVVTYAYVWTCMVKARGGAKDRPVRFMYVADFRDRLDPKVPDTYFGNCILPIDIYGYEAKTFLGEDGFVKAAEILSDSIRGLRSQSIESAWNVLEEGEKRMTKDTQMLTVTGSNQFGIYESDFGWGRPVHFEIMSNYQNAGFSMSKRRDTCGGAEIGICLKKCEMDAFLSLFKKNLDNVTTESG